MRLTNHRILPRLEDKEEYLYVEKALIEQDDSSICIIQGDKKTPVPICSLSCLILGPGTAITHRAIQAVTESRCILVWGGDNLRTFYATGFEKDRTSQNILRQVEYYSDKEKHLQVVRKMYGMRFKDMKADGLTVEQMRGIEGLRMKEIYLKYATKNGVPWDGRKYNPGKFSEQSKVNQLLTVGNQLLYNICRAAIYTLGYSPTIGFIHTGHMDSFVYDLADLYKDDIVIPQAFELAAENIVDPKKMRIKCHERMKEKKLLKQINKDIQYLFGDMSDDSQTGLWNIDGVSEMGVNYCDYI